MDNGSTDNTPRYPPKAPSLKQVLNQYAQESVTYEQLRRILKPVIRKIRDGQFDRRRPV